MKLKDMLSAGLDTTLPEPNARAKGEYGGAIAALNAEMVLLKADGQWTSEEATAVHQRESFMRGSAGSSNR